MLPSRAGATADAAITVQSVALLLTVVVIMVECGKHSRNSATTINGLNRDRGNILSTYGYGYSNTVNTIESDHRYGSQPTRYSNNDTGILLNNNNNDSKQDNEKLDNVLFGEGLVESRTAVSKSYYSLALSIIPLLTIFGNTLVVAAVWHERALQTVTNLLIVSLAVSDFMVAFCVMSFGVYFECNAFVWDLGPMLCNLYIGADVTCSTASILNLLAISLDRFMAIKYPLTYTQYGANNRRALFSICIVWAISLSVGLPVVFGANHIDQKNEEFCGFTNPFFIIISSMCSFFVPCALMIVLYAVIFRQLRARERARCVRQLRRLQCDASSAGGVTATTAAATAATEVSRSGTDWINDTLINGERCHCQIGTYFKMRGDEMLMDLGLQPSAFPKITLSASTKSALCGGNGAETHSSHSISIAGKSCDHEPEDLILPECEILRRCNTVLSSRAASKNGDAPTAQSAASFRWLGSVETTRKSMAIRLFKRNLSRTSIINGIASTSPRDRINRRANTISAMPKRLLGATCSYKKMNGTLPHSQASCVESSAVDLAPNGWALSPRDDSSQSDSMTTATTIINYASLVSTPLDSCAAAAVLSPSGGCLERSVSSYSNVCESASSAHIMLLPKVQRVDSTADVRSRVGRCIYCLRGRHRREFLFYGDGYHTSSQFCCLDQNNNSSNNDNKFNQRTNEKNGNTYGIVGCRGDTATVVLPSHHKSKVQKPTSVGRLGLAFARLWRHVYAADGCHVPGELTASTYSKRFPVNLRPSRHLVKKATKQMKREQKATITLAIVLAVFLVCWVPFFALHLTNGICLLKNDGECVHFLATFLSTWLGYLNSSLNPLIYTLFDQRFRKAFRNVLRCVKH